MTLMRKKLRYLIFYLFAVLLSAGVDAAEIAYPYYASPEREKTILTGYQNVKVGMSVGEVKKLLGEPDETHDLYEPNIKSGKKIGFTYWYLIQRIRNSGSQRERNEKLVRVSFGLDGKTTRIDKW